MTKWQKKTHMIQKIKCCEHCVPPKRHPGCHAECQEYKHDKAEYEELKAEIRSEKQKAQMTEAYFRIKKAKQEKIKRMGKDDGRFSGNHKS